MDFTHLHTADDINQARVILMCWGANLEGREADGGPDFAPGGPFEDWRGSYARQAEGIAARAVELGLETPL